MAGLIICPKCSNQFEPTDAFREEVQLELRNEAKKWQARKEEEYKQKEAIFQQQIQAKDTELNRRLAEEKQKLQQELKDSISKSVNADFENRMKMLQQSVLDSEEKLKEARRKELNFLQQEQALIIKEQELELSIQRRLMEERVKMKEQVWTEENERLQLKETQHLLEKKELQKQLDDQKKLVDELKRKQEQGSMQLQGEVQELAIEEWLHTQFPLDTIDEVKKGANGADCIQIVHTHTHQNCGKICYESKRTKNFGGDWIAKLKEDTFRAGAHASVLVTQVYPRDMERMGMVDGVWICSFDEFKGLCAVLRQGIIQVDSAMATQENKGDKMVMLYDFLTGNEFHSQEEAIVTGFKQMQDDLNSEKTALMKTWAKRQKQIDKVLENTVGM